MYSNWIYVRYFILFLVNNGLYPYIVGTLFSIRTTSGCSYIKHGDVFMHNIPMLHIRTSPCFVWQHPDVLISRFYRKMMAEHIWLWNYLLCIGNKDIYACFLIKASGSHVYKLVLKCKKEWVGEEDTTLNTGLHGYGK